MRVPSQLPWEKADTHIKLPRSQWAEMGVRNAKGGPLESDDLQASLLLYAAVEQRLAFMKSERPGEYKEEAI